METDTKCRSVARLAVARPILSYHTTSGLVLVLGKTSQLEVSTRFFISLMILWYTLAIVYTIFVALDASRLMA